MCNHFSFLPFLRLACPSHRILHDLIILMSGERYKLIFCRLTPVRSRYSSQHSDLKHPQSVFLP
jgi:hypothetical protein